MTEVLAGGSGDSIIVAEAYADLAVGTFYVQAGFDSISRTSEGRYTIGIANGVVSNKNYLVFFSSGLGEYSGTGGAYGMTGDIIDKETDSFGLIVTGEVADDRQVRDAKYVHLIILEMPD